MRTVPAASEIDPSYPSLWRYRPWLYAAAAYNLLWGSVTILFPELFFRLIGMSIPSFLPLWQVLGMYVLVFAPGYWWAARYPERHAHLVLIGLLGKTFGPIGYLWASATGQLPPAFGLTILTNDLIWLPSFALYLRAAAHHTGGWTALLSGR
jgi:hypothetical protein